MACTGRIIAAVYTPNPGPENDIGHLALAGMMLTHPLGTHFFIGMHIYIM